MAGATNRACLFTKEDNDIQHYETSRDNIVTSPEAFASSESPPITNNSTVIPTINSNTDTLWGVLERGLVDQNSEELTTLIKKSAPVGTFPAPNLDDDSSRNQKECISSPPPISCE